MNVVKSIVEREESHKKLFEKDFKEYMEYNDNNVEDTNIGLITLACVLYNNHLKYRAKYYLREIIKHKDYDMYYKDKLKPYAKGHVDRIMDDLGLSSPK